MKYFENIKESIVEKERKAIARIKQGHEIAEQMEKTLIVAYSGGKDSDVLLDLAIRSGVPIRVEHNHTTVDAPQTIYHIRKVFQRLTHEGIPNKINYPPEIKNIDGRTVRATIWNLIPKKQMPPTRLMRYCCEYFKERVFEGQHIMTGVRWQESNARKKRGVHEKLHKDKNKRIVFFNEDDDCHKLTEICQLRNRIATNPIIDWTDEEIWDYIHNHGLNINPLYYTHGMKRVGCIGCPMAGEAGRLRELARFPKYIAAYIRAFDRMIEYRQRRGLQNDANWKDGESVYNWWTNSSYDPNQMTFDDILNASDDEVPHGYYLPMLKEAASENSI